MKILKSTIIILFIIIFNIFNVFALEFNDSYLISHRGTRDIKQNIEANSFEAYNNSGKLKFYACEGDLQYNKEYNWFYMAHDETNNIEKALSYCGFNEFLIINKYNNCRPFIDIKYSVDINKMINIIKDLNCEDIVICQASNENQLKDLQNKNVDTCLLLNDELLRTGKWFKLVTKYKVKMINISSIYVNKHIIDLCHRDNIKVCTYCVDGEYERSRYLLLGIDYIMTNNE